MRTGQAWHGLFPFAAAADDIQNVVYFVVLLDPGLFHATHQTSRLHINPQTLELFHQCKDRIGHRVSEQWGFYGTGQVK